MITCHLDRSDHDLVDVEGRGSRAHAVYDRVGDPARSADFDVLPLFHRGSERELSYPGESFMVPPSKEDHGHDTSPSHHRQRPGAGPGHERRSDQRKQQDHTGHPIPLIDGNDAGDSKEPGDQERGPLRVDSEPGESGTDGGREEVHKIWKNEVGIWEDVAKFPTPDGGDRQGPELVR